jgi:benzoyl-CoA 2,3-dioxygenase component B
MNELKTDDVQAARRRRDRPATMQRYLNFHYSVTIDLFGADESSNAATFYSTGLKGRFEEGKRRTTTAAGPDYKVLNVVDGKLQEKEVPMLNALNEVLRDDYIKDSGRRDALEQGDREGRHPFRLTVPHKAFNRRSARWPACASAPTARS